MEEIAPTDRRDTSKKRRLLLLACAFAIGVAAAVVIFVMMAGDAELVDPAKELPAPVPASTPR